MAYTKADLPKDGAEAFRRMLKLEFKPFTRMDWACWCGCNSRTPYIAYEGNTDSERQEDVITILLDGDLLSFNLCFDDMTIEHIHFKLSPDDYV